MSTVGIQNVVSWLQMLIIAICLSKTVEELSFSYLALLAAAG